MHLVIFNIIVLKGPSTVSIIKYYYSMFTISCCRFVTLCDCMFVCKLRFVTSVLTVLMEMTRASVGITVTLKQVSENTNTGVLLVLKNADLKQLLVFFKPHVKDYLEDSFWCVYCIKHIRILRVEVFRL